MQFVAAAAIFLSVASKVREGREKGREFEFQAVQTHIQSRGEAVKYEQQANNVLRRSLEAQAASRARAAAGGVDPFSGSAMFNQTLSAKDGGEEFNLSRENAKLIALGGDAQVMQLKQASRNARRNGLMNGIQAGLTGAVGFSKLGGPTTTTDGGMNFAGSGLSTGGGTGLKSGGGLGLR